MRDPRPVLVTGATGYLGGRLVPRLLAAGWRVRALARSAEKLRGRPWAADPRVEIAQADALEPGAMARAAQGCSAAYWLVHSMNARTKDFADTDRRAAAAMAGAAEAARLAQVVYMGGLGEDTPDLSEHLRSRAETARVLAQGSTPVTTLRAAMVIGSGSASFEILRYLVDRLPVMVTPRWVDTPCQPIAVRDVLACLVAVLGREEALGRSFDVGGPEVLTYRRLMEVYAEEAGLRRRRILRVPVLTPRLSSYWIHLVTPVPAAVARPLAEGLRNPVVCRDEAIHALVPGPFLDARTAIRLALARVRDDRVESHWTDAGRLPPSAWADRMDPAWAGGAVRQDAREVVIEGTRQDAWAPIVRLGGRTGWYFSQGLWRLRGAIDRLLGGAGLRRGRRHDADLLPGDALDFWRVRAVEPGRRLLLADEMRLPGRATLEFAIEPAGEGRTRIRQTAAFLPRGLAGLAYWAAVAPFHHAVFHGMLAAIAHRTGRRVLGPPRLLRGARRP